MVLYSNSVAATISNKGKIAKMVHPDFFGKDVDKNTHHSESENWWLQVASDKDIANRMINKLSTPPFPLSSIYHIQALHTIKKPRKILNHHPLGRAKTLTKLTQVTRR